MRRLLGIAILSIWAACGAGRTLAQPPTPSEFPSDFNSCVLCHTTPEVFEDEDKQPFFLDKEKLAEDAHFLAGVKCHECHGGNPLSFEKPEAHAETVAENELGIVGFRKPLNNVQESCDKCHDKEKLALAKSVHAEAGARDFDGRPTPLSCRTCHGEIKHHLYPADDRRSRVFLNNQVKVCGGCHEKDWNTYTGSVHGRGLEHSGLLVVAVCADCHGSHSVFQAEDERSLLHPTNVAGTCANCHRFIEERLRKSVHGRVSGPGGRASKPAPGGKEERTPTCTDCHYGHNLPQPHSGRFRLGLPNRCGNCHLELSEGYRQSLHGALTELGYGPAAECSDCHGGHDILPVSDPESRLALGENRLATCKKCHPNAVQNFCNYQPHANHRDAEQYPLLHYVHLAMELLIFSVFAFFGVHTILWFVRSMVHFRRHGRPQPLTANEVAYVRFEPIHRILHALVIFSFLGLSVTGLPLKYSDQAWAQVLARSLGGFESTSAWHRICAVITFFYFATHVLWIARQIIRSRMAGTKWLAIALGPDSPIPGPRDLMDIFRMGRWFVGKGPKPVFERWTYWEKFDYWAVFWGVAIIGTSGLMLWFPTLFCRFLPGELLNFAKVIHSEEALLATSFIFAIHFFGTHLRPEKFPMDMTILTGLITEEEMQEERPEFAERMREAGNLEDLKAPIPSRGVLLVIRIGGFLALAVGLGLLVGILLAALGG